VSGPTPGGDDGAERFRLTDDAAGFTLVVDPAGLKGAVVGAVVMGVGLLEAVLVIGPAFAVGARRSARARVLFAAVGAAVPVTRSRPPFVCWAVT
jgi:hypothetical protein